VQKAKKKKQAEKAKAKEDLLKEVSER